MFSFGNNGNARLSLKFQTANGNIAQLRLAAGGGGRGGVDGTT